MLVAHTECGVIDISPGEVCGFPREFRIVLQDDQSRGYICENYSSLPERGPVGSDGFANDRDFLSPVASYEDREGDFELVISSWEMFGVTSIILRLMWWPIGTAFPTNMICHDLTRLILLV